VKYGGVLGGCTLDVVLSRAGEIYGREG